MKKPNFQKLYELVCAAAKNCILDFASSQNNKDVYALVFDLNEDYGDVQVSINTEEGLKKTIVSTYSDYTEDQISGLNGLKYSSGDFAFFDICKFPEEINEWSSNYNAYLFSLKSDTAYFNNIERFSDTICQVLDDLDLAIAQLDKTEEFIAYHCFHDVDEETDIRLLLKSISQDRFDEVFPEYKEFERFINDIDSFDEDARLKIWLDMLVAYFNYGNSRYSKQFFRRNIYLDIAPQLIKVGSNAIDSIFDVLDSIIYLPEFNEKGTKEWEETGAFSRRADVVHLLLDVIASIGTSDTNLENRLLEYIVNLQSHAEKVEGTIGLNLCLTARCLHYVNNKYPSDDMCPSSNRLLNYEQYLKNNPLPEINE